MPIDYKRINAFISNDEFRESLAQVLRKSGFEITWIHYTGSSQLWGFYVKLNQPLKDLFSIYKELLIWVVEFDEYQIRSVSQAVDIVAEDVRLTDQLVIVITGNPDTSELVKSTASQMYPVSVGFSIAEIIEFARKDSQKEFVRVLQSRLYYKDVYWMSTPIQSPRHFYGRQKLLSDVASTLASSQDHVGIFGLRKMGKTSFLYRLLELLQQRSQNYVSYLDMQLLSFA
jgi:hypothetical protein